MNDVTCPRALGVILMTQNKSAAEIAARFDASKPFTNATESAVRMADGHRKAPGKVLLGTFAVYGIKHDEDGKVTVNGAANTFANEWANPFAEDAKKEDLKKQYRDVAKETKQGKQILAKIEELQAALKQKGNNRNEALMDEKQGWGYRFDRYVDCIEMSVKAIWNWILIDDRVGTELIMDGTQVTTRDKLILVYDRDAPTDPDQRVRLTVGNFIKLNVLRWLELEGEKRTFEALVKPTTKPKPNRRADLIEEVFTYVNNCVQGKGAREDAAFVLELSQRLRHPDVEQYVGKLAAKERQAQQAQNEDSPAEDGPPERQVMYVGQR
jgi:hypothetical protein